MMTATSSAIATPFPWYPRRHNNFLSYTMTMTAQVRTRSLLVAFLLFLLLAWPWPVVVRGTLKNRCRDFENMNSNENERMMSSYDDTNNNNNDNNNDRYHPSGPPLPLWPDKTKIPGERPGRIGKETVICKKSYDNGKPTATTKNNN
jgi:hypothetical protein